MATERRQPGNQWKGCRAAQTNALERRISLLSSQVDQVLEDPVAATRLDDTQLQLQESLENQQARSLVQSSMPMAQSRQGLESMGHQ